MSSLAPVLMVPKHGQLRRPPAQHHRDAVRQFVLGEDVAVLGGHLQGVAQSAPGPGDDADLGHRVGVGEEGGHQGVPRLVEGHGLALPVVHHPGLLLQPGDDPLHGRLEVLDGDGGGVPAGRQQGRLVHGVGQVGAAEAGGDAGGPLEVEVVGQLDAPAVDLEDLHPADEVGVAHLHLPVEPAGAQQGFVQHFRPVGGGHDDHRASRCRWRSRRSRPATG